MIMKNLLSFEKFNENTRYVPKGAVTNPSYVISNYDYLAWSIEKAYSDAEPTKNVDLLIEEIRKATKEYSDSDLPKSDLGNVLYNTCEDAIVEYTMQKINDDQLFKNVLTALVDYGHDFEDAWVGEGPADFDDDEEDLGGSYTADEDEDD